MSAKRSDKSVPKRAAERLNEILSAIESAPSGGRVRPQMISIAAICRDAGISRNSLYRYHQRAMARIKAIQEKHHTNRDASAVDRERALRAKVAILETRLGKMAALVDHYFSAYQEAIQANRRRDKVVRITPRTKG
jgi:hypothetical protein